MVKQDWELLKEIRKVKKLSEEKQQEYWTNKFDKLDSSVALDCSSFLFNFS